MKAQFWSFDIIFAIVIFVFAILILTFVWLSISSEFSLANTGNLARMQIQLQSLSASLLSPGTPANWNSEVTLGAPQAWENISVGLGNGTAGSLSQSKINELNNMSTADYQATKPALGVAYDYNLSFIGKNIAIGGNPSTSNAVTVQTVSIPAVINGNVIVVRVELWTNGTTGLI